MKRLRIDLRSLSAQMVLSLVALVLLTAAAVGLPAIWLIRDQLDRQAWAQVDQGSRAARALYAAWQSEVIGSAILMSQLPDLRELVAQETQTALPAYMRTLQTGLELDLVLICDSDNRAIARAGKTISEDVCRAEKSTGFHIIPTESVPQVWLLAGRPIFPPPLAPPIAGSGRELEGGRGEKGEAADMEKVIVGVALDDEFAVEMRAQTGLDHTLLVNGQPVATSFVTRVPYQQAGARRSVQSAIVSTELDTSLDDTMRGTFKRAGRPYYFSRLPLSEPGLEDEIALAVANIVATERRLVWTVVGSIVVVAAVGSVLGVFLAQRIGRPLARLAGAADTLSQGDLDTSVAVEAQVSEVALVAQALEGARVDLQRTLVDLRREKAWIAHLLEAIIEGIVTLDDRGHITFFSQGAERITGWSRDQVLNRSCDEVFRPVDTDQPFSQLIPAPGRRHKIAVELTHTRQATLSVTRAQLAPPEAGEAWVALVFRDVSEEEAIQRILGHFLANVTHEFRTPLAALAASIELLLDQAPDLSPAELQQLLTSLHLGILGLQTLVDNLLESASIEAGRFRVYPRPSDLGDIIAEATRMMQPLLDKHDQPLVVELPTEIPVVQADPRRTVQVLVNLLSNASKYGPDGSEITVSAAVSDDRVQVLVADRGPGVPSHHREDLFHWFVHPDPNDGRAQYGAGLGLWVVKAIVEAHGGQVGVEDRPGGGSIFWFTLPVVDKSGVSSSPRRGVSSSPRRGVSSSPRRGVSSSPRRGASSSPRR